MNFYREAAKILDDLGTKRHGSLKSIVFNVKANRTPAQQKRLYALLSETLKSCPRLHMADGRQKRVGTSARSITVTENREEGNVALYRLTQVKIPKSLALVLLHDFLCSKQGIAAANGPIKEAILRHKTRLKSEYVKAQVLSKAKAKGKTRLLRCKHRFRSAMGSCQYSESHIRRL